MASNFISEKVDLSIQIQIETRSIMASEYISEFHLISGSKYISKLTQSWPPSWHDHWPQVHLQPRSITASKYIFKKRWLVYGDTRVVQVDWMTGSIYAGDLGEYRLHLIFISSYHTTILHTVSSPKCILTCSFQDFADLNGQMLSYHLSLFLHTVEQNRSFSQIAFWCRKRDGRVLLVVSLTSGSIISPQWPPSGTSLSPLKGHLQVLLRSCLTTTRGQIDFVYIPQVTWIIRAIL